MKRTFLLNTIMLVAFVTNAQTFEWTEQNSGVSENLTDVYFASSQVGWAVGENGTVLYTGDGGNNWTSQIAGVDERVRAVFALDEQTAFIVGGELNKIMLSTTDGGTNWDSLDPNNQIGKSQILDVVFTSATNGWVITTDSIYYTSDAGVSWVNEVYSSDITRLSNRAIAATTDSTAYIASRRQRNGVINPYADVLVRRSNPEATIPWTNSTASTFSTSDIGLYAIDYADDSTGFAGGAEGIIYKSENPIGIWEINLDLSESNPNIINSISFPTSTTGMFGIGTTVNETNYLLVYHTNDEGATWSSQPDSIAGLLQGIVHSPDASYAWAVGAFGKIFKGVSIAANISELKVGQDLFIYPNPATDIVHVEFENKSNSIPSYTFSDLTGRIVEAGDLTDGFSNNKFALDISYLPNGYYILTIFTSEGQATFKILKDGK
jgi:photosystem II stability/assembly factor-like uncharacterized protein